MNYEDMKETWINALRSGEYKQQRNSLHNRDGFCCLGVAAVEWKISTPNQLQFTNNTYYSDSDGRSKHIKEVDNELNNILGINLTSDLIRLNDFDCADFSEIADYIEENWNIDK